MSFSSSAFAMDYYRILGLRSDASSEDIKKAFRELALKLHPDRHANSSKKLQQEFSGRFKQVSEAYEVLSDAKKRAVYNREGRAALRNNQQGYGGSSRSAHGFRSGYGGGGSEGFRGGSSYGEGWSSRRWPSRLKPFNPMDFAFHGLLAGIAIFSFIFVDSFGDVVWQRQNPGKSFEDMIETVDRSKHERATTATEDGSAHHK
ncbi:hypothetical protein O6H91_08G057800 [Diphasiastrum complanatum]|uniref:Uncharacterized protein n=1 Tax=Diphasiastrum complanatum TaxID=34168 RepID=A0ACC2CY31_DIPCM|nr:hypothetical protein O6H91_08G057800 [Diphasiastrum complanatum]